MKNKALNIVWVDFKTGCRIDLSNFRHLANPARQIPYFCQSKNLQQNSVGQK